jgi:small GTP-binding protein
LEQLGHANILISGQTGAGKSTLINAVFRVALAEEGIGKPVTKHVQKHEVAGVPVTIFDTPGIELGQAKNEVIREFTKTITQSRKGPPSDLIHVAWYCINTGQSWIQDYDIEIVRALADEVPVMLVLTQCIDDERAGALEEVIRAENLPIQGEPERTLQSRRVIRNPKIAQNRDPVRSRLPIVTWKREGAHCPRTLRRAEHLHVRGGAYRSQGGDRRDRHFSHRAVLRRTCRRGCARDGAANQRDTAEGRRASSSSSAYGGTASRTRADTVTTRCTVV